MEGIAYPTSFRGSDQEAVMKARLQREQSLKHRGIRENLAAEKMSKREVDDAIRVTEERLEVLKNTVKKMRRKDEN